MIEYENSFGRLVRVEPIARFVDEFNNGHYVIRCGRGTYDVAPPFTIVPENDCRLIAIEEV